MVNDDDRAKLNAQEAVERLSGDAQDTLLDLMNMTQEYPFPAQGRHVKQILEKRKERRDIDGIDF
jgi:hypothetical protein